MKGTDHNHIIHARKFANKDGEIRLKWMVKDFPQLCEVLYNDEGEVKVLIQGRYDHNKQCLLETEVKANLTLECQTSFEPIDYVVDSKVTYCTVIKEEQVEDVSEDYEAILIEDGLIDMKKVIEDELILSVPIAANKPTGELTQKMSFGELDEEAIAKEEEASNPFSVLTGLKKD